MKIVLIQTKPVNGAMQERGAELIVPGDVGKAEAKMLIQKNWAIPVDEGPKKAARNRSKQNDVGTKR